MIALLIISISLDAFSLDFESSEGFTPNNGIENQSGWQVTGPALITDEISFSGSQSLKIPADKPAIEAFYQPGNLPQTGVRFIELAVKPVVQPPENAESSMHVWGSNLVFVRGSDGNVEIAALGAKGNASVPLATPGEAPHEILPTAAHWSSNGASDRWLSLVIRQDLVAGTWDLFVDGKLQAIDLPLDEESSHALAIYGSESAATYVDGITATPQNPLFQDDDSDGIPTAIEVALKTNAYFNDRDAVRNPNGLRNIEEFLKGSRGEMMAGNGNSILYVDNLNGSNANTGVFSYAAGNDGPKAGIKAAMAAANSGDTIVVLPGTGVYEEGNRGARGKRLTIKTVEPVKIK